MKSPPSLPAIPLIAPDILSVSDKTKPEKIAYLKALGATVYVCPASVPADDPRSYYEVAKRLGISMPLMNRWKNEKGQPNGINTLKLVEMAKLSPSEAIKIWL